MSLFTDFLLIMGAIVLFLAMLAGIINWLSRGFWGTWLRVRMSKGNKWLVRVWTPTGTYYKSGKPDGMTVKYKDKNKQERTIETSEGTTYKSFGVDCIETDEVTNGVRVVEKEEDAMPQKAVRVKGAFHVVPGFDAVTFDTLLQRAYELGRSTTKNKEKIILLVLILVALGLVFSLYMSYNMSTQIQSVLEIIQQGPVV